MITEIIFPGHVPGNNGRSGLLRMHWTKRQQLKERYAWQVAAANPGRHTGPVRLELIRHSTGPDMDYDNLVSTGKLLTDCLVKRGVIPDDKPAVIVERDYRQTRAKNSDCQMTVIRIIDLPRPKEL